MDRQNVNQSYENLIARLHAVRRQWWWLTFSEGLLKCIGMLTLVMVGVLVILNVSFQIRQVPFLLWGRIGILLLSIAITVYIVIRALIIPLSKRFTDAAVASRLELTQGESELASENRILSAVQLWKNLTENRLGYAPEFIEHLIIETDQDMEHIQRGQVFQTEFRKIKRNAGIAIAGVGLLLITHFLLPNAFNGFAATFQTLPQTLPDSQGNLKKAIQITEIQPGNTQIERGTDVNVAAKVSRHIGAPVTLYYRIGDGNAQTSTVEWQSMPMRRASNQQVPGTAPSYHLTLENVTRPLQYYISVEEVASAQYQVTISDEPIVTQFQYRLNYPAYTRLQSQTFPANTGDIQTLFGTELVFTGESNKPLQAASLAFEESDDVKLEITARHLTEPQQKQLETKWKADIRSETQIPPSPLTPTARKIKKTSDNARQLYCTGEWKLSYPNYRC